MTAIMAEQLATLIKERSKLQARLAAVLYAIDAITDVNEAMRTLEMMPVVDGSEELPRVEELVPVLRAPVLSPSIDEAVLSPSIDEAVLSVLKSERFLSREQKILDFLRTQGPSRTRSIAHYLSCSSRTAGNCLRALKAENAVIKTGHTGGTRWSI